MHNFRSILTDYIMEYCEEGFLIAVFSLTPVPAYRLALSV